MSQASIDWRRHPTTECLLPGAVLRILFSTTPTQQLRRWVETPAASIVQPHKETLRLLAIRTDLYPQFLDTGKLFLRSQKEHPLDRDFITHIEGAHVQHM